MSEYNSLVRRARIFFLLLWLLGILFPMAWLGNFSVQYRQAFNAIFSPEWMHYLMHAVLYAGLAIMLVMVFRFEIHPCPVLTVLGLVLLVGIIQEGLQLWSGVQALRWNSLLDLGVDLSGAGFGLLLSGVTQRISARCGQKGVSER